MFWIFLLFVILAVVFIKLGSLSVWVSLLSGALNLVLLLVGGLVIALLWRKGSRKKQIEIDQDAS